MPLKPIVLLMIAPLLLGGIGQRGQTEARLLAAHNRERASAGVAPLRWSERLARDAADWAGELARRGAFEHAADSDDGENLWMGTRGHFAPEAMVGLWIDEKRAYRAGPFREADAPRVGHYTQVMWRGTSELGCAIAMGEANDVLVCRYAAAGNVIGERAF